MKNTIHPPYRKLKLLVILPLIAAVFYAFATPEYKYVDLSKNSTFIQGSTSATENVPAEIRDTVKSSITTLEGNFIASSPMGENSPISGFRFTAKSIQGLTGKGSETVKGEDISLDLGNTTSTIFINEKEVTKAEFDRLDPNTIASVSILKGEAAINKFGDKGKNGVILISLKKDESNAYTLVEQMPEFPGGEEALKAFITANIKYPAIALENGIHGLVVVKFVVDKTGSIPSAKITRGVDPALDNEALRIVTAMPKWNPGKHNGENVAAEYELPINFKLPEDYTANREKLFLYYETGIKPEDQAPETKKIIYSGNAGNGKNRYILENSDYTGEIEVSILDWNGKLVRKEMKNGPTFNLDYRNLNGFYRIFTRIGSIQYIGYINVGTKTVTYKSTSNKKAEIKSTIGPAVLDHELIIVPNPTGDRATITLKDSDYNSKLQVSIFDKNGKLIGKDSRTGPTFNLSFANYTSGNYFIVVKADKDQYSGQLIVNH